MSPVWALDTAAAKCITAAKARNRKRRLVMGPRCNPRVAVERPYAQYMCRQEGLTELASWQAPQVKLENDFGVAAADFRGGYRNAGA